MVFWPPHEFTTAVRETVMILVLRLPLDSMRAAMFTVSPKRQ